MEIERLINGHWYKSRSGNYFKFEYCKYDTYYFNEKIMYGLYKVNSQGGSLWYSPSWLKELKHVHISEIQQYLPDNHPDKLKDTFILPDNWYCKITDESRDTLNYWRKNIIKYSNSDCCYAYILKDGATCSAGWDGIESEITFSQFKQYVWDGVIPSTNNIPEYVKCIINYFVEDKIGVVFKTTCPFPKLKYCEGATWFKVLNINSDYFIPSTKEEFDLQNQSKDSYVTSHVMNIIGFGYTIVDINSTPSNKSNLDFQIPVILKSKKKNKLIIINQ